MAEERTFPRWMYPAGGPAEPDYGGRCFDDQAALDAAASDGPWFGTPEEASQAAADHAAETEPPPRRSHR